MSIRSRFALLTVGRLVLGVAAIARATQMFRDDSFVRFPLFPLLPLVFGIAMLYWGIVGVRALRGGHGVEDEKLIARAVADVDRRAPSGLKPLWIGILAVIGLIVVSAFIASIVTT